MNLIAAIVFAMLIAGCDSFYCRDRVEVVFPGYNSQVECSVGATARTTSGAFGGTIVHCVCRPEKTAPASQPAEVPL